MVADQFLCRGCGPRGNLSTGYVNQSAFKILSCVDGRETYSQVRITLIETPDNKKYWLVLKCGYSNLHIARNRHDRYIYHEIRVWGQYYFNRMYQFNWSINIFLFIKVQMINLKAESNIVELI